MELPAGSCILLHFPPAPQPPTSSISDIILRSDNGEYEDRMLSFGNTSTFNCVTFALGDLLDLGPGDWIEPLARSSTFYTVPADVVLDSYCEPVLELSSEEVDWEALASGDELQEGDIFCFCEKVAGRGRVYSHMGKVWRRNKESLLVSKLGVGPIVKTSLQLCAEKFHVDSIVVYRRK